jgi:spermidine/putrescine transport system permease protein
VSEAVSDAELVELEGSGKGGGGSSSASGAVGARSWTPYALLTPGMLWLGIFFVVPTAVLVDQSLQTGTIGTGFTFTWAFDNYSQAMTLYGHLYVRSFIYALIATVGCLLIAYPLAYTIAFKAGRWKNIMLVLVIAPFFTSFLIRTSAWQTILSDSGLVVRVLNDVHLITVLQWVHLTNGPRLLATPTAVIAGLTYNFLPFMTLPLYASLDRLDPRLIEAGQDLYGSPFAAFRKVTFPLSLPGVVAGTLLTFIPAAGDPINAKLLGTPAEYMIGNAIDSQFLQTFNYPMAAALSVTLMVAIVTMVVLYVWRTGTEELV